MQDFEKIELEMIRALYEARNEEEFMEEKIRYSKKIFPYQNTIECMPSKIKKKYEIKFLALKKMFLRCCKLKENAMACDFPIENEFVELYYNFPRSKQESFYSNKYYRIYGWNIHTNRYENIPKFGVAFPNQWELYSYIAENNFSNYSKLNIVEFDKKEKKDILFDSMLIYETMNETRKKNKMRQLIRK